MSSYILDKAYRIMEAGGCEAYLVLAHGEAPGEAIMAQPNDREILGVSVHSRSAMGNNVAVRKAGIVSVKVEAPILQGWPVMCGREGRIRPVPHEPGEDPFNCLGFAETAAAATGDLCEVFISMHQRVCA